MPPEDLPVERWNTLEPDIAPRLSRRHDEGVRFLWVADLARSDSILLLVVTVLTAGSMMMMPKASGPNGASSTAMLVLLSVGGTLFFLWSASSAMTLSVGAGSLVSTLQSCLLIREGRRVVPSA